MRLALWCTIALLVSLVSTAYAGASTADLLYDGSTVALATHADGSHSTSVGFTNLTDADVGLTVKPAADGCKPSLDHSGSVPRQQHIVFAVAIPTQCKRDDARFAFTVTTIPQAGQPEDFTFTAIAAPVADAKGTTSSPDWGQLQVFLYLLLMVAVAAVACLVARAVHKPPWMYGSLPYLEAGWSFGESWVSNVTVGGSLLTGLFGTSEVVKTFLGDGADAAVALSTVASAIAVAFVGVASIVLLACKSVKANTYTVPGVLLAGSVTLAGALGELYIGYHSGRAVSGGELHDLVLPVAVTIIAVVLVVYAVSSTIITIHTGITPPVPADYSAAPLTETVFAAAVIAEAIHRGPAVAPGQRKAPAGPPAPLDTHPAEILKHVQEAVPHDGAHRPRRRAVTAML